MFKMNNDVVCVSLLFILNIFHTLFQCFYCYFEYVFVCWVDLQLASKKNQGIKKYKNDCDWAKKQIKQEVILTSIIKFNTCFHIIHCPVRVGFSFKNFAMTDSNGLTEAFFTLQFYYVGRTPKFNGYLTINPFEDYVSLLLQLLPKQFLTSSRIH